MNEKLFQRARRGDQAAFAELFQQERPKLLRIASGILKGDAEDAVSIAYEKAWRGLPAFDPAGEDSLSRWLGKIVRNTSLDMNKRNQRWTPLNDHADEEDGDEAPRYTKKGGGPTGEEKDGLLNAVIAEEEERKKADATSKARRDFLKEARREIGRWPEPHRRRGLRIGSDPRIEPFLDELAASAGSVGMNQYLRAVRIAAECAEPFPDRITPEDARTTIKTVEYLTQHFSDDGAIPENIGTILAFLRPIAVRRGTKTTLNKYECILRLDSFFRGMCGPRRSAGKAIRLLLGITFGGKWTAASLSKFMARAREATDK
ncbi:MAG: hypothetical protein Kow00128_19220 [Deltaproteobacteria bacterium]